MAETKRKYEAKETEAVSQKMQKTATGEGTALGAKESLVAPTAPTYTTNPAFLVALTRTPVESLKPVSNVILVAQRTDKVTDVWKGLVRNNFLSCPVLQQTKKKYYGFVDMHDIVNYITTKFDASKLETAQDFRKLLDADQDFQNTEVTSIIKNPILKKNPYHPVTVGYSLFSAVELLAREQGLHRVPVIDRERQLKSLVTQSQVVDFVVANMNLLGDIRMKPLSTMEACRKEVMTLRTDMSAMDAFKFLAQHEITGAPVVDSTGKMLDVLTLKDLKAISTDANMFWRLYQNLEVFLKKVREETAGKRPNHPIYCLPNQTFEVAIRTIAGNRIHRVIVVDSAETMKPIGIVTMKDVLLEVIS